MICIDCYKYETCPKCVGCKTEHPFCHDCGEVDTECKFEAK